MANGYITEFASMIKAPSGDAVQAGSLDNATVQAPVSFTTTTQSAAFAATTRFVRVQADAACFIAYGSNPTATASGIPLAADMPEYFAVSSGNKIAFVTA